MLRKNVQNLPKLPFTVAQRFFLYVMSTEHQANIQNAAARWSLAIQ